MSAATEARKVQRRTADAERITAMREAREQAKERKRNG